MLEIRVEIPALDRLCGILEQANKGRLLEALQAEIVKQLEEAAKGKTERKAGKAEQTRENAPEKAGNAEQTRENVSAPAAPADAPVDAPAAVTLDAVQRACAGLRDAGKLSEVKALFPEFGIKKLSDLEDAQLEAFAGRLRQMGGAL